MKRKIFSSFILFIFIISIFISVSLADDLNDEIVDVSAEIETLTSSPIDKDPQINSRAYVVIDRNTNMVLYGKNENEKKKMASTTKIMTAIVVLEKKGDNLQEMIEVSKKAAGTGGSRLGLKTGDKITILNLLYGLLLCSGNDAAVALAEATAGSVESFAELMNQKAMSLGLNNSHFVTPHGLDSDKHYTTAYELAVLSNYALHNTTFAQIVGTKNYTVTINTYSKSLNNTNELLGTLNGVYGVKTGFTNGANRCLVTACKRNQMDVICVVLGADTKKFRTTDSIKLIEYTLKNFNRVNLQEILDEKFEDWKSQYLDSFCISKGTSSSIILETEPLENSIVPIRKDFLDDISVSISCLQELEAPLTSHTAIGSIELSYNNKVIAHSTIYLSNSIQKKSIFNYLLDFFKDYPTILNEFI